MLDLNIFMKDNVSVFQRKGFHFDLNNLTGKNYQILTDKFRFIAVQNTNAEVIIKLFLLLQQINYKMSPYCNKAECKFQGYILLRHC